MAEAIMLCCIYVGPFIALLFIGALIMEVIIPAVLRKKARRRRYGSR